MPLCGLRKWPGIAWIILGMVTAIVACRPLPPSLQEEVENGASNRTSSAPKAAAPVRPPPPRRDSAPPLSQAPAQASGDEGELNPVAAADLAWAALEESVEYSPTLAVWLFDLSPSAQSLVSQVTARVKQHYMERAKSNTSSDGSTAAAGGDVGSKPELQTAVVFFGEEVELKIDPPTANVGDIAAALDATRVDPSGQERTFTAIRQAVDRFLPLRPSGGKVVFFVVTDEAGDDWPLIDELVPEIRREALPFYVIGNPAPLGMYQATRIPVEKPSGSPPSPDWRPVRQGPESRYPELVAFQAALGEAELSVLDSGFGPFALEWLCRAGGGSYLAIRPKAVQHYVGLIPDTWPSSYVMRFPRDVMRNYMPDYVTEQEYNALLASNKAMRALRAAAQLEPAGALIAPQQEFVKTDEAQLNRIVSTAQQQAALLGPPAQKLYELLKDGEADRDRLKSRRWQAAFDLALGRASMSKARIDGYNAMLAQLKRGMAFQKPTSNVWVLEPADELPESALQKMADRGRESLERVVREHPQTPWAALAEQALKTKAGWKWTER